jgi:hypothetical protein
MSNTRTREEALELTCRVYWDYHKRYFLENEQGNWVWQDPEFGGNNTLVPYQGSYPEFLKDSTRLWEGFECQFLGSQKIGELVPETVLVLLN